MVARNISKMLNDEPELVNHMQLIKLNQRMSPMGPSVLAVHWNFYWTNGPTLCINAWFIDGDETIDAAF